MGTGSNISVGSGRLNADDFERLIYGGGYIALDDDALSRIDSNFQFLQGYASNKIIYGINTGLGPMAQYKISDEDQRHCPETECAGESFRRCIQD